MADLPTCWYCPECGYVAPARAMHAAWNKPTPGTSRTSRCQGEMIELPLFPPGTPLTVILDTLGYTYTPVGRAGVLPSGLYVTISPATGEARDGSS